MSSAIFYRFKSQKDTSRILFDGTGLTVFDLKREIILENKLGDGTDFQIRLYSPDTNEEYEDDSQVIPRSSSIVVRRSPAIKAISVNGRQKSSGSSTMGNATRYVTGKPRVFQKKGGASGGESGSGGGTGNVSVSVSGVTEEERIANMFANQENQWEQTQQEMSAATPIFYKSNSGPNSMENEGPPPPGYMCYRCGGRDHWIKSCPTNSDPNFEGKRIRRTTGIPKKFLKTVEIDPESMTAEEMAQRKIMVTDEGKFVIQVADQSSWEEYQRKQQNRLINGNESIWRKDHFKNLPDEMKCPITGGLLRDPVTTSRCCKKFFSKAAIENYLLESDFVCPGCETPDILLDSLVESKEKKNEVEKYIKEHENDKEPAGDNLTRNHDAIVQNEADKEVKKRKLDEQSGSPTKVIPPVPMPMPPFGMPPFPMPFMPFPMPTPQQQQQQQISNNNDGNGNIANKNVKK
ncbi:hypothetical protein Kpol_1064p6 [Vanderwaltozyma polyspora DSM 70294]|uniref:DWNN domain-containing protein n=1 Tax=Vanderwaltozyma polyspora (strain ATCC 22028 / DSM 70294 / BCRC 21397 / CBS 2163 / NBRC 10782 / NRRL Y-8283 / UCD 57-17) TaxID=436907 RepID=A7TMD2_VANPO|nr:uncharacterized protein Kpol_1064p6 [Vanderwaltozyma polyspora DSM 70294]EDO16526.1 hypothetical protein Kpol_1064p6 [Vanderwaltozyma polyspora DSM 70294]